MCYEKQQRNGGRLDHKGMTEVLATMGCANLNREKVYYRLKKLKQNNGVLLQSPAGNDVEVDDNSLANISELTSPSVSIRSTDETNSSSNQTNRKLGRPKKVISDVSGDIVEKEKKAIRCAIENE